MSQTEEMAIEVTGLCKDFGSHRVVNDFSISMPKGAVWGFLGPNGSGKTTTIRMLCGLLAPSAGSGHCLGLDIVKESSRIKLETGYMTQKFSFWDDLTIRENLEFVARLYQLKPLQHCVDSTLKKLSLVERQHQLAADLSGGWKQRLALAAVTMHEPKLLLLDEPTAGVDPQARRDFWDEIHRLADEGLTVLVSTHYMDEAERCDHIVYLAYGTLVVQGSVEEIIAATPLSAWRATGKGLRSAASELRDQPAIEHVAWFGSALHVSGKDEGQLKKTLAEINADRLTRREEPIHWQQVPTTLEDAFIALGSRNTDQRYSGEVQ